MQEGGEPDVQFVRSGWYDPAWTDSQPDQGDHKWWLENSASPAPTKLDTPGDVPKDEGKDKTDSTPKKISKSPSVEEIMSEIQELKRTVGVLQLENTTLKSVVQSKEAEIESLKKKQVVNVETDKPEGPPVAAATENKEVPVPPKAPLTSEDTGEKKTEEKSTDFEDKGVKASTIPEDTPEDKAQQHVSWAPITKQGLQDFLHLCRGYISLVVPKSMASTKLPVAVTKPPVSKERIIEWHPVRKDAIDDFMGAFRREAPQDMTLEELIEFANGSTSMDAFEGVQDEVMATIEYIWYLNETWNEKDPINVEYWLAGESGPKFLIETFCNQISPNPCCHSFPIPFSHRPLSFWLRGYYVPACEFKKDWEETAEETEAEKKEAADARSLARPAS